MPDDATRVRDQVRHVFLTGVAVIVPLLITLIVLAIAFNYIYDYLDLFSTYIVPFSPEVRVPGYGVVERELVVEIATPFVLLMLILFVGLVANSSRYGERAVDYFDYFIEQIPGVGSVYEGFRQMSDVMLESDSQNFQEVVLVEFPTEGTYALAFVTSETPDSVTDPVGKGDMTTLFMPMAPNPVMGGHVVFVPDERIVEIDMTVDEGIRALVTSGVAIDEATGGEPGLAPTKLRELSMVEQVEQRLDPTKRSADVHRQEEVITDRPAEYDREVDPEQAQTPGSIAQRERDGTSEDAGDTFYRPEDDLEASVTPAERAGRYPAEQESTDRPPTEAADRDPEDRDETERPPTEAADRDPEERDETATRPSERADRTAEERDETETRPSRAAGRDTTDTDTDAEGEPDGQ